jgi:hypothetical protein
MWSQDAGVFPRELVQWRYMEHACLLSKNLIRLLRKNSGGFSPALWKRLEDRTKVKDIIYNFLTSEASLLYYIVHSLGKYHLISCSGEFGGVGVLLILFRRDEIM